MHFRIDFKVLLITYEALNGLTPQYISDLLSLYNPAHTLRSSGRCLLSVPEWLLKIKVDRAFEIRAPRLWNTLHEKKKRQAESVASLKSKLVTYFHCTAFPDFTWFQFFILFYGFYYFNFCVVLLVLLFCYCCIFICFCLLLYFYLFFMWSTLSLHFEVLMRCTNKDVFIIRNKSDAAIKDSKIIDAVSQLSGGKALSQDGFTAEF